MAKPTAERRTDPANPPRAWHQRVPWVAAVLSLAVILASGWAVQAIRDPVSGGDVAEAYLVRPLGYVALAPLSAVLDTIVLLSLRQHAALLGGFALGVALWRAWRWHRGHARWRGTAVGAALFLVAVLVVYAAAALLPRPMASLETDNASIVRIDFHSHTDASHDGRMSVADNRAWHRRAGYDVAFITDHGTVTGAERAMATNPQTAAEGVVLLQSIEVTWWGEHVSILGAQRTYTGLLTQNLRDVDTTGLRLGSVIPTREPVVIWHHPRDLARLPTHAGPATPGVRAIEIVNGSPDNMNDMQPQRAAILALARDSNLAVVAGSDNHGWGHAAPGWTLLRIFNWRSLSPDMLAMQIEAALRRGGYNATRVVERRVADGNRFVWASAVTVPWRMLTTLSPDERIVWLLWIWLGAAGGWLWRRRRATV